MTTFLVVSGVLFWVQLAASLFLLVALGAVAHDASPRAPIIPPGVDPRAFADTVNALPAWRNADAALAARLIEDEALAMAEPNLTDEQRRAVVCARHRRAT